MPASSITSSVRTVETQHAPLDEERNDRHNMVASASTLGTPRHHSRTPSQRRRAETHDSDKAGRSWAREVEDPWWPCILTLDGGGIRGYSSLLILKALMHEIWLWEQHFDAEEAEAEQTRQVESPTDMHESQPTTSGANEMEGSTASVRDEERALQVEESYGVAPPTDVEVTRSSRSTVAQDQLTADISIRKAMSEEELLPCHYFDFMYGTSTGGLIATILGRLRMTVSEGLELYRKVGEDLFGQRRSSIPLMTKYYHEPLERAVRDIVGARCHEHVNCDGNDLHPWDADKLTELLQTEEIPFRVDRPRVCHSCCLTATHDENVVTAYLLRSYPHYYTDDAPNWITRYNEGADALPIWKVTRATTAAPFYFEMLEHEGQMFKDGGIRENNPSGAALSEFQSLYAGITDRPALLLSVGTGRPDQKQDGFALPSQGPFGRLPFVSKFLEKRAILQHLVIKYTEGERQHHHMREYARGEHTWYKRLDVSTGLENMPLDDWIRGEYHGRPDTPGGASLTRMEEATESYLERDFDPSIDSYAPPSTMLRQAAEKLVRQRRARERMGGERWDTFVGKHLHHIPGTTNGQAR